MLKIIMVRHGMTEGNLLGKYIGITDEPVLEEEKQALKRLRFPGADAVYASPMLRCVQTAEILYPGQEIITIPDFSECDFGEFEGRTYQELIQYQVYRDWVQSGEIEAFPGGERRSEFQERCIRGLEKMIRDAQKKKADVAALVVHGGTIMSILDAYGFPRQAYNEWHVGNGEGFQVRLVPEVFLKEGEDGRDIIVDRKLER